MKVSVIIPTWNEAEAIEAAVASCQRFDEVIVADGGSTDETCVRAARAGAVIVEGAKGRGPQLNAGAKTARGDALVFLHADCRLMPEALEVVERALRNGFVGGNFRLRFAPQSAAAYVYSTANHFRRRFLAQYYGDSCIFLTRDAFESLGGFPETPIMEDYALTRALERFGRTHYEERVQVIASSRRFAKSPVRTLGTWALIQSLYSFGVTPERLARLYRDIR